MSRRTTAAAVVIAAIALVASACSSSGSSGSKVAVSNATTTAPPTAPTLPAPEGDAFYTPPDPLPPGAAGDLIWSSPITPPPAGTKAWRILYRSTTVKDEPVAVSGLLVVPDPLPPERPVPVLAVAHGTTGLADRCAPSRQPLTRDEVGLLPKDITAKYVVVATDYQGLGTPGVHPYVVGLSEGRNVLDSIRVAQRFGGAGTTGSSKSVVWGHSQGGGATLLAAELEPTYAPDTNLAGVAAGAPAAELKLLGSALKSSPYFGYVFMVAAGFKAAYPELDLTKVFTPAGVAEVERAGEECGGETVADVKGKNPSDYISADAGATEPFASLLEENSPGVRKTSVPIFIYQGEADEQIPVVASKLVLDRYCRNGTTAWRKTWPGATHVSVIFQALPDIETYLSDRLAGSPPPTSC